MLRRLLLSLILAAHVACAAAEGIELSYANVVPGDDTYVVNADFEIDLRPRQQDALHKGLSLHFVAEFELTRARWYWFDESVASQRLQMRLAYQPLTRQYRVYSGTLYQSFTTLQEALQAIEHVRNWPVASRAPLKAEQPYLAALRMRLDVTQLPKPFQVDALTNREWNLSSDWKQWQFSPSALPAPDTAGKPTASEGNAR